MKAKKEPKFNLGNLFITPNAQKRLSHVETFRALHRHAVGDWGEVTEGDREENELSLREGFRIVSVYHSKEGEKFWIITEADRSATTVLMPEDY
jgi:hypothetical protein